MEMVYHALSPHSQCIFSFTNTSLSKAPLFFESQERSKIFSSLEKEERGGDGDKQKKEQLGKELL
jgi:hypothetical protein